MGLQWRTGHEEVLLQSTQLSELPAQIGNLEETIASLQAQQRPASTNSSLSLPLPATLDLAAAKQAEASELSKQLKALQQALPRKTRELERAENELRPLEVQASGAVTAAKEAWRRKEDGDRDIGDGLELRGRWYRSAEAGLRDVLKVKS